MKAKLSLNEAERTEAQKFVRQGKANARTLTRAWNLLKLADGWDEAKIAETFAVTKATVKNVTQRFARSVGLTWCCMIKCSSADGRP